MQRYCFIANYFLTPLQMAVAAGLRSRGIESVFIVVNRKWRDELLAGGWSVDQVLYLPMGDTESYTPFERFPIKFMDLITADRALRFIPRRALAYLHGAAETMYTFLIRHNVKFVFGEPTWAHERLAHALCRHSGNIRYLSPHTVRYPANRWGFFPGEDQTELFAPTLAERQSSAGGQASVEDNAPPPYLARNNQLIAEAQTLGARLRRLKRYITRENIDPHDPTAVQSRWHTLKVAGTEEWNRIAYRKVRRAQLSEELLAKPFVLYALHKQPESSIDVIGRYYEDQNALVQAIWRSLPSGWSLYVKEHTNAIGDRSPQFYEALQSKPQLVVLDEKISANALLTACRAVFTVSGTIAYEAGMQGVPAFTFAPMFFNSFPSCRRITIDDLRDSDDLQSLISQLPAKENAAIEAATENIRTSSFPGRFTDVYSDPTVLSESNVRMVVDAFASVYHA